MILALAVMAAIQVTPPSFSEAKEPQIAIGSDHTIYAAYGMAGSIYVSVSQGRQSGFAAPVKVGELPKLALGMRRGPRIAVCKGTVTVTAISHQTGELVAYRSTDRGKTWSKPSTVNDSPNSAREGLHAMAAKADGTLVCTWLDLRTKGTKLYLSYSKDGGATWAANRMVYESPSGSICECCHPTVAFSPRGELYVMFRNSISGARDMYLLRSAGADKEFGPARKLGKGTWMLNACPMDGGALAFTSSGEVDSVWRRADAIYRTGPSGSEEELLSSGKQPWIAVASPSSIYYSWSEGRNIFASTPEIQSTQLSSDGEDSVVAASPDGSLVIAAWTEGGIRATVLKG